MTLDVYADLFDADLDALGESIGELVAKEKCGQNVGKTRIEETEVSQKR